MAITIIAVIMNPDVSDAAKTIAPRIVQTIEIVHLNASSVLGTLGQFQGMPCL